jgi:hypothetical protein
MKVKFFIGYDDRAKLIPILDRFGRTPFTKSVVVKENVVPDLTSGDITRWGGNNFIEKVKHEGESNSPNHWRLTPRTIGVLSRR